MGLQREAIQALICLDVPSAILLKGMLRTFPMFVSPVEEAVSYWSRLVEEKS